MSAENFDNQAPPGKHVVFVTPGLGIGGSEHNLIRCTDGLVSRGYRVSIIVIGSDNASSAKILPEVSVYYLGLRTSSILFIFRFLHVVRQLQPDVLIGRSIYANFSVGIARMFRLVPKAVVMEGNYPPATYGQLSLGHRLICRVLTTVLYRCVDVVSANSNEALDVLRRWVGGGPRYKRSFNPLNFDQLEEQSHQTESLPARESDEVVILAVGRFYISHKGFDILLRACARLLDHPKPWKLWLVGEGADLGALQDLARSLGLYGRIEWCGVRFNPFPLFRAADIIVLSSRHEGFPNVLLEAMALGKATVATDCHSGPAEMTKNGEFGLLVPVDNDNAMASAISRLINDPKLRHSLGGAGRDYVRKAYSEKITFSTLIDIIER